MKQLVSLNEYRYCVDDSKTSKVIRVLWELISLLTLRNRLCIWSGVKRDILALFGATLGKNIVIKQGVCIKHPWKLTMGDYAWIGEGVWIDNIERVDIGSNVCLSQGAYLCTGNHDWSRSDFALIAKPIVVEDGVWVGAKAMVGPGVRLKSHSVVTAGSVVTQDTEPYKIYQGNPATCIKDRVIQ